MNDYGEAVTLYAFVPIFREQERSFWQRVAEALNARYSTHLVISGRAVNRFYSYGKSLTTLPLNHSWINSSQPSEFKSSGSFKNIVNKIQSQASLWDEDYSSDDQLLHASSIALHLSALNPIAALIWNWHRPEGMLARAIAESMGIECWDIERTPWPGMLTLDKSGQLSETNLAASLRIFSNRHPKLQSPLENGLQQYIDRADEYISITRSNTLTWWQQPCSGISSASEIQLNDDYANSKYKILFAGQVDNDVQNFLFNPHFESNIEAFTAVLNSLPEDSFVVGKHHPKSRIPVSAYQQAIDNANHVTGVWTEKLDVVSSLSLVDHVIAVNSSFLFEALFAGKSCFELGTTMLSGLDVFFDCANHVDLKSAISYWLSSPPSDYKRRVIRYRVLTGFALSHGLLSFEGLAFTFKESDCESFMMKWAGQVLGCKAQHHADLKSKNLPLSSEMSSSSLAVEGLIHYASSVDALTHELSSVAHELSIERSAGVKKAALALLASIRKSIRHRIR
ncbi:MAG: hypothetical protein KFB97_11310 [Cyanobium sp. M30B3]|nr:MAG: hypothetical protein KFB97_11310 [Cyanobium sp. M30B3]